MLLIYLCNFCFVYLPVRYFETPTEKNIIVLKTVTVHCYEEKVNISNNTPIFKYYGVTMKNNDFMYYLFIIKLVLV